MAKASTQQRILNCLVAAIFIAAICLLTLGYIRSKNDRSVPVKSMATAQQADAPLGYRLSSTNISPVFDHRFIQLTAFERAQIPTATRMTYPMGSENGALTYNAQPYWSQNKRRGGHHTGDDLNGIGGMNTDQGDPVYALANGLVVYRGEPSQGWGKTVILAHRSPRGQILLSMYAHLDQNYSPFADLIPLGETIGTVGTANNNYPAHLHLEMRDSTGVHIGSGYKNHPGECVDPMEIINSYPTTNEDNIHLSPLTILLKKRAQRQREGIFIEDE